MKLRREKEWGLRAADLASKFLQVAGQYPDATLVNTSNPPTLMSQ